MTALAIVQIGHPRLRERAREVTGEELGSAELQRICDDLVESMRTASGAGGAARRGEANAAQSTAITIRMSWGVGCIGHSMCLVGSKGRIRQPDERGTLRGSHAADR